MAIMAKHLSKSFDNDLHDVIELFMQMGHMAAEQVMVATRALIAADEATAKKVIADDHLINQLEIKIDEQIILLVTPQGRGGSRRQQGRGRSPEGTRGRRS